MQEIISVNKFKNDFPIFADSINKNHNLQNIILPEFDLEPIKFKLNKKSSENWPNEYISVIEVEYRRFLGLVKAYSTKMVPSRPVDKFWHQHILDTRKYEKDCNNFFGYFLHHFPYLGMRGEEDRQLAKSLADESVRLYSLHFNPMPRLNFSDCVPGGDHFCNGRDPDGCNSCRDD